MSSLAKVILAGTVVILTASFVPFTTVAVPEWRLTVVDVNGKHCVQNRVTQQWSHDSLGIPEYGGVDNLFTEANGIVTFPERTVTASLSYRVVVTAVRAIGALVHAGGWGIHGSVYTTGFVSPDGTWALIYRQGKPLPDKLVVEECLFSADIDAFNRN